MAALRWWGRITPGAREWLIANNGAPVSDAVAAEITGAGGEATAGAPLADESVDWIEAVANGEDPDNS